MDNLQIREKEIFNALKRLKNLEFVVIGGYAVNAYAILPRFSVDCDIVVKNEKDSNHIEKQLNELGFTKEKSGNKNFYGDFKRFEKNIENNFKVSFDILIGSVVDRKTNVGFPADWIFENSEIRALKGKTINEELNLKIVNLDCLFVLKFVSCRTTDIRDIFMIAPKIKDKEWIKQEISNKYPFKEKFSKIKEKITSKQFKDNIQGVYGVIDIKTFEKHIKAILNLEK